MVGLIPDLVTALARKYADYTCFQNIVNMINKTEGTLKNNTK